LQNDVSIFERRAKSLGTMTKRRRMVLCFAGQKERACLLSEVNEKTKVV